MTDPEDIDLDDLVFSDDLEDALEDLRDDVITEDDFDPVGHDDVKETADKTFMQRLSHLVEDDCDTEACNQLRDQFGLHDDDEPEGDEDADTDESEADADDESEGDEESDTDETDADSDGSDGSDGNYAFSEEFR